MVSRRGLLPPTSTPPPPHPRKHRAHRLLSRALQGAPLSDRRAVVTVARRTLRAIRKARTSILSLEGLFGQPTGRPSTFLGLLGSWKTWFTSRRLPPLDPWPAIAPISQLLPPGHSDLSPAHAKTYLFPAGPCSPWHLLDMLSLIHFFSVLVLSCSVEPFIKITAPALQTLWSLPQPHIHPCSVERGSGEGQPGPENLWFSHH